MFIEAMHPGSLELRSVEEESLPANSVRVAISYAGVCHSDVAWVAEQKGPYPRRLGHEASGVVTESSTPSVEVGTRVVAYVGDAYAHEVVTSAHNVVPIDPACDLRDAALAEPLACVIGGYDMLDLAGVSEVAVVGAGFMGLLMIRLLASAGYRVHVVEPRERTRALALQLGAVRVIAPEEVTSEDHGRFPAVIEAVGELVGLETCTDLVTIGGTLGILGYHQSHGGRRDVLMERWNFAGLRVLNLHHRNRDNVLRWIDRAQRMSALGVVNPARLVDAVISLAEVPRALTDHGDTVKVLVEL